MSRQKETKLWVDPFIKKKAILLVGFVVLASATALLWCLFAHSESDLVLSDGMNIRVSRASMWKARWGALCEVKFKTVEGAWGRVSFGQDLFNGPLLFIPANDGTNLLCLYDDDTDLRLIRVDAGKSFPQIKPTTQSEVEGIVFSSTCRVEKGGTQDWRNASQYLRGLSKAQFRSQEQRFLDLGILRIHTSRDYWLKEVQSRISKGVNP